METVTIKDVLNTFPGGQLIDKPYISKRFLTKIFYNTNGYIEVRLIRPGSIIQRYYETVDELMKDEEEIVAANRKGYNVYFGVCRRIKKSGRAADVAELACLWADIDRSDFDYKTVFPTPNIVLNSGNGFHLYWLLNKPIKADQKATELLRGIQRKVGSDSVSDVSRVLRLPCTNNMKDPQNPKAVTICHMT